MSQYSSGLVAFVKGSDQVVGTGTNWAVDVIKIGDQINHATYPLAPYTIGAVDFDTQTLTLTSNYAGESDPAASYQITTDYTANLSLPELSSGDLNPAAIVTRALRTLDVIVGGFFVEASSQEEEDAAFAAGARIVIRTDLLPIENNFADVDNQFADKDWNFGE